MSRVPAEILKQRLSAQRIGGYVEATAGDLDAAIALYEWNCAIAAALFEVLGDVEVIVRNALHDSLTSWHARGQFAGKWHDNGHGLLAPRELADVTAALLRLKRYRKPVSSGAVVAELNFGFWRYLLTKKYSSTLWPAVGRTAFPNMDHRRPQLLWARMARLHDLRNRIAHHEPIHWRDIALDLTDCLMVIRAVCPVSEAWSRDRARVLQVLALRPVPTRPNADRDARPGPTGVAG
jgi:hypothetical protein